MPPVSPCKVSRCSGAGTRACRPVSPPLPTFLGPCVGIATYFRSGHAVTVNSVLHGPPRHFRNRAQPSLPSSSSPPRPTDASQGVKRNGKKKGRYRRCRWPCRRRLGRTTGLREESASTPETLAGLQAEGAGTRNVSEQDGADGPTRCAVPLPGRTACRPGQRRPLPAPRPLHHADATPNRAPDKVHHPLGSLASSSRMRVPAVSDPAHTYFFSTVYILSLDQFPRRVLFLPIACHMHTYIHTKYKQQHTLGLCARKLPTNDQSLTLPIPATRSLTVA